MREGLGLGSRRSHYATGERCVTGMLSLMVCTADATEAQIREDGALEMVVSSYRWDSRLRIEHAGVIESGFSCSCSCAAS